MKNSHEYNRNRFREMNNLRIGPKVLVLVKSPERNLLNLNFETRNGLECGDGIGNGHDDGKRERDDLGKMWWEKLVYIKTCSELQIDSRID